MKIKVDENLPAAVANVLRALNHDVATTIEEELVGRPDEEIWTAAQRERRFLITQDLGFSDLRRFPPGTHAGILLLRLSNPSRRRLAARVDDLFRKQPVETWTGWYLVATEQKLRVIQPR